MIKLGNLKNYWKVSDKIVDLRRTQPSVQSVTLPAQPQKVMLDLEHTAIIVIDMQNDFCTPGGWLDSIGVDTSPLLNPVDRLNQVLPELRKAGVPVIWVNWGNRQDRMNVPPSVLHVYNSDGHGVGIGEPLPENGSKVLEKGSWGAAIIDQLTIAADDIHVDKYRMSGFWDTPLDSILRNLNIRTLLFAGVNLDQCVMHTLQDAACLGYDSILLEDCSATSSPSYCTEAALYNIKQCYGFVAESAGLMEELTGSAVSQIEYAQPEGMTAVKG
ncbi:cysteine hydrolase family protein [Paenibacillus radicis (ex Gao et al. 2016)]|uniref:Peroxyureidoacrylate/ureidoacrylate amidohydrolase RutB n=1 Tax=Paenibacillus radicis (ex Gao et al. 2016) TaxID=1737354 RepID=A0A917H6F1_9BACL|nr:cysteine hydrolase family protein [Paenibacillus radicis (ex Gao et al. 2016)]GGG69061.1 peroxyureidoacrylate/ureidoacrylate amidohydrolase RutB [Paenibacillus radicis (ex Gao et al. 2016)]